MIICTNFYCTFITSDNINISYSIAAYVPTFMIYMNYELVSLMELIQTRITIVYINNSPKMVYVFKLKAF